MNGQVFLGIGDIVDIHPIEVYQPLTYQQETVALRCCETMIILGTHKSEETCPHCGTTWRYESKVYGVKPNA